MDILSGRPRAKWPYMENCFSLIQGWIDECSAQHSQCVATSASLPTQILNVGQAGIQPRLEHTPEDQEGHYIWLSYNWGGANFLRTTQQNLRSFMQGIPFGSLPRMFQDAIHLARRLGISYLYIDALCIIQGDMQDCKQNQQSYLDILQVQCVLFLPYLSIPQLGFFVNEMLVIYFFH